MPHLSNLAFVFALSFGISGLLVLTREFHMRLFAQRDDLGAQQSLHVVPTPRVGGVGIMAAIVAALFLVPDGMRDQFALFSVSLIPVFVAGLAEDLGYRVTPSGRLIAAACSALLAVALLQVWIGPSNLAGVDMLFAFAPFAILFTLLWTAGICHGFNLIDGVNGLAASAGILIALGLWAVADRSGQPAIAAMSLALVPALAGFLIFNWPFGRIFLGDAGAYGLGHMLVWLAIILAWRAPEVSPASLSLMFFWPVADTFLAIWRRRRRGRSFDSPDRLHFHQLLFRLLYNRLRGRLPVVLINSLTGFLLVPLVGLPVLTAVVLWDQPALAVLAWGVYGGLFVMAYAGGVRYFTSRGWRRPAQVLGRV